MVLSFFGLLAKPHLPATYWAGREEKECLKLLFSSACRTAGRSLLRHCQSCIRNLSTTAFLPFGDEEAYEDLFHERYSLPVLAQLVCIRIDSVALLGQPN